MSGKNGSTLDIMKLIEGTGTGTDQDRVAMVLFLRNLLPRLPGYPVERVALLQKGILRKVAGKDFSDSTLRDVCATVAAALSDSDMARAALSRERGRGDRLERENAELKEKVEAMEEAILRERSAAASLVDEMTALIVEMKSTCASQDGSIDGFRDKAVDVVSKVCTETSVMDGVKGVFNDMRDQFSKESKALKAKAASLEKTANYDALLSELFNRRALDLHLGNCVMAQEEGESPLSMMMIDVDHFKAVNDTYGHVSGDMVLQLLASIMVEQSSGYGGFPARYGGEELVIVMPDTDIGDAMDRAEMFREAVSKEEFQMETAGRESAAISLTVSVGVSQWRPGMSATDLVQVADTALYRAKREGRDRVICG